MRKHANLEIFKITLGRIRGLKFHSLSGTTFTKQDCCRGKSAFGAEKPMFGSVKMTFGARKKKKKTVKTQRFCFLK